MFQTDCAFYIKDSLHTNISVYDKETTFWNHIIRWFDALQYNEYLQVVTQMAYLNEAFKKKLPLADIL